LTALVQEHLAKCSSTHGSFVQELILWLFSLITVTVNNLLKLIVLLRLSKSAPKLWFFSNIEPYRNRGFRLSIDGFGFLVSKWRSSDA